ncbi:MAG TPA: diaminopimelate decarboxylase, partial [Deinococcales bacterium]|nr:diaminopimelate decarboxylase [Deinococcales bacterium]
MNLPPAGLDARRRDASRRAAAAHGTPLYLLDWDEVRAQAAALQAAFPGALCLYAMKANPLLAVLGRLSTLGWGFEAVSAGELERAARAAPGAPVVLNGPGKTPETLDRAAALGAVVAVDALDEIERVPRGAKVLLVG